MTDRIPLVILALQLGCTGRELEDGGAGDDDTATSTEGTDEGRRAGFPLMFTTEPED